MSNMASMTFAMITLGCKVNQYESDRIKERMAAFGFGEVRPEDSPDVCIVNTCTVTREAARKSRQMIRRSEKSDKNTLVYAVGCAAEIPEQALPNVQDGVIFVKNEEKERLPEIIAGHFGLKSGDNPAPLLEGRIRTYLKVQDGCDNFCSYCIIPYVRGRSRSREPEEILEELRIIEQKGFREVVFTGIHIGDYGKKIKNRMDLPDLIDYLLENSGIQRFRISSLEPMDFSYRFLEVFEKHDRLCRHLHLPLQHGSDPVLRKMNRKYTLEEYDGIVRAAAGRFPDMALTTDIITGFPGERDEDFRVMYDYVERTPFFMLHVFPYSSHPGTKASGMEGIVPASIKEDRLRRLICLGKEKTRCFLENYKGERLEVLAEKCSEGKVSGHTGNYINVEFPGNDSMRGKIFSVFIKDIDGEKLHGENPQPVCNRR